MSLSTQTRQALRRALHDFTSSSIPANHQYKPIQLLYSSVSTWPRSSDSRGGELIEISVLDSSFNPPSLAHLALTLARTSSSSASSSNAAHLLLFSARNADKGSGRPGDAKPEARLHMMVLLAHELEAKLRSTGRKSPAVAVALVEEPLIVSKSTLLHELLSSRGLSPASSTSTSTSTSSNDESSKARLNWLVGTDTLVRFFEAKYYGGEAAFEAKASKFFNEEGTRLIAARRPPDASQPEDEEDRKARKEEEELIERSDVKRWAEKGAVELVDVPEARGISSTKVRELLKGKDDENRRKRLRELCPESIASYLETEKSIWTPEE